MSLTAPRSAALLAPLPEELRMAAIDAASPSLLAPVEAHAVADSAAAPRPAPVPADPPLARKGGAADGQPASAAPVAATLAQPAAPAAIASSKAVFPARTATIAQVGKPAAMPQAPAAAGSIGSAVVALAMVVGLILALGWLAKRMPGFRGASANSALRVVGSLALSPRERLVVVAVGDTQLVLGVGAGGTRTLHTLGEPLPVAGHAAAPAFAQLLSQHFGKKP